jgi:pectate lyase
LGQHLNAQVYELSPGQDAYEPNDTADLARDLKMHNQYVPGLSIDSPSDMDWFRWTPARPGTFRISAYEHGNGPLFVVLWDATGSNPLAISASQWGAQRLSYTVGDASTSYTVLVVSGGGGTNSNYTLLVDGSASDGWWNLAPTAPNLDLSVVESRPTTLDLGALGARDSNGDPLHLMPHASPYGHVVPQRSVSAEYWPGTSIDTDHEFTYVLDDGEGGRAKGTVHVTVQPIADDLAFVGAEGFGALTPGGRGRPVYRVNRLEDDSQAGSLRWALNQAGAGGGIIVFDVGGPIVLSSPLYIPSNTTLAGDTAPEPGITVFGRETRVQNDSDIIVRYMRFRHGNKSYYWEDAFTIVGGYGWMATNVILDHCSLSWGNDACIDIWNTDRVTMQWCIISEGLLDHSTGCLVRNTSDMMPGHVTLHHNLWAHNASRSPWAQDNVNVDIINNVMYNWQSFATYVGSYNSAFGPPYFLGNVKANVSRNYYISGPDSPSYGIGAIFAYAPPEAYFPNQVYVGRDTTVSALTDSYGDFDRDSDDQDGSPMWLPIPLSGIRRVDEHNHPLPWSIDYVPITEESSPIDTYEAIWPSVGASRSYWDDTDSRILLDVITRSAAHGLIWEPPYNELP